MYEAGEGVAPAGVERLLQRIQHKVRAHGGRHPPAHNASRKHVDDERDVDKADNGTVEGLNNKAKLIIHRAYGFRTAKNYIRNLYHCMADLPLPQTVHTFV